ncbi:hypothetical protein [Roseateles puraquae]|uniref:hypothetical protein n=2 Tax=Roseateles puraquae TaxID=431059 RepID=UPI0024080CCD|nr:hypothetical protein [Roseateles puraquae]
MSARRGLLSIVTGALGLVCVLVARQVEPLRGAGSSWLLNTADRLGLIRNPPAGGMDEATTPGLLSFTDETALNKLLWLGVLLGLTSLALSLSATARREDSLYLGAGLICGGLALVVAHYFAGMGALVLGSVVLLAIRLKQG